MEASIKHPVYNARLVKDDGTTYRLKDITTDLTKNHEENELAERVSISLVNIKVGSDKLHNLISLKDRLYLNANTGTGEEEVFRGFVWTRERSNDADSNEIRLICYDRLIYWQKSKDNFFAKAGKTTKTVITSIAEKWGFTIQYNYLSITHAKLTYHNESIADIITDILNKVKKQTGVDYVIRMEKSVIVIEAVGSNKTVYKLVEKENAVSAFYRETMEDMVTKVLIVKSETSKNAAGDDEETGQYLTVASVSRNTDKYGTLQEILVLDKDEKLTEAKEEANQTLDENSTPKEEAEIKSVDIPWVKKGDQIYISAGGFNNYYIVKSVEHDATDGIMYMEVKLYE